MYKDTPPEEAVYQSTFPELAAAPIATVPVPHLLPGVEPVIVGAADTVTVLVSVSSEQPPVPV